MTHPAEGWCLRGNCVALNGNKWSVSAYRSRQWTRALQSNAADIVDLQRVQTTLSRIHYFQPFLSGLQSFPLHKSWHYICWHFRPVERFTNNKRLIDSETMHLHGYFASTSLQFLISCLILFFHFPYHFKIVWKHMTHVSEYIVNWTP